MMSWPGFTVFQKFDALVQVKCAGKEHVLDAHRPAGNAGARLDVFQVATETITLTRTFGMIPASRDDIVAPAVLERVVIAANAFVKAGLSLDPAMLEGTSMVAVKRFYDAARKVSWLDPVLKATRLRERAWRCASQSAYFALQEHQRRCKVIPAIVSAMQGISLSTIREKTFPSKYFLAVARDALKDAGLPGGCLSVVYLSNMARYTKHLIEDALCVSCREAITRCMNVIARDPRHIVEPVIAIITAGMEHVPAAITRALSRRLTRRMKERARSRGKPIGTHHLDVLVDSILARPDMATWQKARRAWRDASMQEISKQVSGLDVPPMVTDAVKSVLAAMTVDDALATMFSSRGIPRVTMTGVAIPDPERVLHDRAAVLCRNQVGATLWAMLVVEVNAALASISKDPAAHVVPPRCKKQCIPVAIDDGQVFRLDLRKEAITGHVVEAKVRFSLEPGMTSTFHLRGLDRIDAMVTRGFTPTRGTITRKPGGGLLLHLPFEKACTIDAFPAGMAGEAEANSSSVFVAGVDLGLKHLAWLSIGECRRTPGVDGSREPVHAACAESARYCIDQPRLVGTRGAWLEGGMISMVPNVKRQLISTIRQARALQRRKDLLRQQFGKGSKHAWRYFVARREWQRCWRRVRHLHEEIARQVATRIVTACLHHGVTLLRFEDLSWSSQSSKQKSGSWLASWQVHWFFSQVQVRATLLARLAGIAVEFVDARGTSKRCSACGVIGNRDGKSFTCTNKDCGKKVDSDLNGARNVRIAPTSPRLHAKVEGARYRPLACHSMTSLRLENPGLHVQV